jgi:hypothetical protein
VKQFREAAREGLEAQAKKIEVTSSKKFQKPPLGRNVRIKMSDIDRAKMDPRSIIAVITDIKDEEFYELGKLFTNLPYAKKFFKHRKRWYGGNKCT